MQIYHAEVSLDEGYEILDLEDRQSRLVRGKRVDRPSGWALFSSLRGQPIRCCFCGCSADRWIATKGRADQQGNPVLNLYANGAHGVVLMTRDHIIPKSLGGRDDVANLRPACTTCNMNRANEVSPEVIRFAQAHPELLDGRRITLGVEALQRHVERLERSCNQMQDEIARLRQPFIDMGYIT